MVNFSTAVAADGNNGGKKKMSGKKKFWIIFTAVLLVIVIAVGITVGVLLTNVKKAKDANVFAENPHGFKQLGVRPDREGLITFGNLSKMSEEEKKDVAVQLYETATSNFKNNNCVIFDNQEAIMSVLDIENIMKVDSVTIKNDEEYFRIDYRLRKSTPFIDMFKNYGKKINDSLEMLLTERMYATKDAEKMTYQKVKNSNVDENGVPYAVWDSSEYPIVGENRDVPKFNSSQEGTYGLTAHTIKASTISTANVEYDKASGYYTVKISLDIANEETSANALENIRKGSGDKNASFNQLDVVFTVWDNGYFRDFKMDENWTANAMGVPILKFGSLFHYNMYFSYAEEDCNLHDYKDYKDMMAAISEEQK